jgi:hypothetical protein
MDLELAALAEDERTRLDESAPHDMDMMVQDTDLQEGVCMYDDDDIDGDDDIELEMDHEDEGEVAIVDCRKPVPREMARRMVAKYYSALAAKSQHPYADGAPRSRSRCALLPARTRRSCSQSSVI